MQTETDLTVEKTPTGGDNMGQYLHEINQYPLLTPQEELTIAMGCARGEEEAIRLMVNSNLRLVVSVARDFAGRGVPLQDLIQEGSIGLLTAAKKFDYTRQTRFSTYATKWIRQSIGRYLLEQAGLIRVPTHTAEKFWKIRQTAAALQQKLGRRPTDEELAAGCDIPEKTLAKLLRLLPEVCSLDAPAGEEGTLQQMLENLEAPEPQEALVRRELRHIMRVLMDMLTLRQQQVIRLRFGMDDGKFRSLEEVGTILGISKERARQVEREALEKMKNNGTPLGLEDFLT